MKSNKMDYSKGKIYQILNTITDDVYIGSTCQSLESRFIKHKSDAKSHRRSNYKLYAKMKELGSDVFFIKLVEEAPCESKAELRALEGKYIRELGTLNQIIAGRSNQEWKNENKEYKRELDKKYREKNKEHCKEVSKKWRENNKEYKAYKAKEWRENNKDVIKEKKANHYLKIKDKLCEEVMCEICRTTGQRRNIKQHERGKQHQQALQNINKENEYYNIN